MSLKNSYVFVYQRHHVLTTSCHAMSSCSFTPFLPYHWIQIGLGAEPISALLCWHHSLGIALILNCLPPRHSTLGLINYVAFNFSTHKLALLAGVRSCCLLPLHMIDSTPAFPYISLFAFLFNYILLYSVIPSSHRSVFFQNFLTVT